MLKPTKLPRWADVSGVIVEPSEAKKNIGFIAERPTLGVLNWIFNLIYLWLSFLFVKINYPRTNIPYLSYSLGIGRNNVRTNICTVGTNPKACAFDTRYIWVLNGAVKTISIVDPDTMTVVDLIGPLAEEGNDIIYSGDFIYVSLYSSGQVLKIHPTTRTIVSTISVGATPDGMCAEENYIYVACRTADQVYRINRSDDAVTAIDVGENPHKLCSDGTYIWVSCFGSGSAGYGILNKIRISDNDVATIDVGEVGNVNRLSGIAFDGARVWVTSSAVGVGLVYPINAISNAVGTGILVAVDSDVPDNVLCDGKSVWISCYNGGAVHRFNMNTGEKIEFIESGGYSLGMTTDGSWVYVASSDANWIKRVVI